MSRGLLAARSEGRASSSVAAGQLRGRRHSRAATSKPSAASHRAGPKKMAEDLGLELDEDNGVDFKKMPKIM